MDFFVKVKGKYSYLTDDVINDVIDNAKSILIDQLYGTDLSVDYLNYDIPNRFNMWILQCIDELIAKEGINTMTAYANQYSENGVKLIWHNTGVSADLLARIPRLAGVASV